MQKGWPDAAAGREDSIGAESSHSNKVVIRRLSYLDLLLIGRFLLLYAKVSSSGQQKRNQRDWRIWPNQAEFKIKVWEKRNPFPLNEKQKTKKGKRIKNKFPITSAHRRGYVGRTCITITPLVRGKVSKLQNGIRRGESRDETHPPGS